MEKGKCGCVCHKTIGILVILIGLTNLLGTLEILSPYAVDLTWPILLILIGLAKSFQFGGCKCCTTKK